ncbi:MAG: hypothetical protein ACYC3B_08755 [Sedimentisphaerales bacterium]
MSKLAKGLVVFFLSEIICFCALGKGLFREIPTNVPPQTQACKGTAEQKAATVVNNENAVVFENGHFSFEIQKTPVLSLQKLYSRYTQEQCLAGGSRLFLVWADDRLLDANDFVVKDVKLGGGGNFKKAVFLLNCEKYGVEAVLSVGIDKTPEARLELELKNKSQNKNQLRVLFPYFENILIGDANDNYYFFPYKGGITSNKPYNLVSGYSVHTGSLQLLSLYNPVLGGGIYTRVEDSSGRAKTLLLHKKDIDGNEVMGDYKQFAGIFPELNFDHTDVYPTNRGTVMGCYSYPYKFESKGRVSLPTVILGVHGGDFTYALQSYGKWAHTWFKHNIGTPRWYRDSYYEPCVHDTKGNAGWEQGFLKDNKIVMSQIARPYEDILQVAFCWDRTKDDHLGDKRDYSWYKGGGTGDYNYEEEWGGAAGWKDEIEKTRKAGPRVVLYGATQWAVWFYSDVYYHHSDWAVYDKLGREVHDYWWDLNDNKDRLRMVDFCGQVEEWQDYCAQTNYRIIKDTGADGVFTDVMNQLQFCYNPKHKHEEYPAAAAEKLLKKNNAAVRSANPEAVVEIEDFCSDYLLQWVDGCWMKTFYQDLPIIEDTFDIYSVSFVRFIFPEVRWTDFGPRWIYGSRRALFNGMGYNISEVINKNEDANARNITQEQRLNYLVTTCQLMKETSDVFSSTDVRCLVPTLQKKVYANYFGANGKKFYTIYNKNDSQVQGQLIKTESGSGYHCVELLYDEEAVYDEASGKASLSILPWDVVCLARLPKVLEIKRQNGMIDIVVKRNVKDGIVKIYTDDDNGINTGEKFTIRNNSVKIDAGKYQGKRLIIKLFEGGYLLDEKIITVN